MGDRRADKTGQEPSLELPSLRLPGFRKHLGRPRDDEAPAEAPPAPSAEPTPEAPPQPPTDAPAPAADAPPPAQSPEPEPETKPAAPAADEAPATAPGRRKRATAGTGTSVPEPVAVPLTGLLVGGLGVGLTWAGLRGCEALRGTSSCGGPGLLLLVAILALMVLVGSALLRLMRVPDAGGTSLLGVGVVGVVTLVGLLDVVFSPMMLVALPVLGAVAFALARWVTTRFVDMTEQGPDHDVR